MRKRGLLNQPGERLPHARRAFKILAEYALHYAGRAISGVDNSSGFVDRLKIALPRRTSYWETAGAVWECDVTGKTHFSPAITRELRAKKIKLGEKPNSGYRQMFPLRGKKQLTFFRKTSNS